MINKTLKIINKLGLHARAAMKLVNLAGRYQSEILICFNQQEINAKDLLNVMTLGAKQGTTIELTISGEDENDAMAALSTLINNRFDETE